MVYKFTMLASIIQMTYLKGMDIKMKNIIRFTVLVVALIIILPLVSSVSFATTTKPLAIVVGHTNGVVTMDDVIDARKDVGLIGWDETPFTVTFSPGVTSIGSDAFNCYEALTSVVLPDGLITIGDSGFSNCSSLTNVVLPGSLKTIGDMAFFECTSLKSITIRNNVTSIGEYTFSGCESLTNVVIPDSVKALGDGVFSRCKSLTSVVIGNNVPSIGYLAFTQCISLKSIMIPNSVKTIGEGAFEACFELTIYCYRNSYAHNYSIDNVMKFILRDSGVLRDAQKPTIKTQPKAKYTVKKNKSLKLKVFATVIRGKLSYQWYKNTKKKNSGGKKIVGATKKTYAVKTKKKGTTYYYCVITNKDNTANAKKTASRTSRYSKVVVK